MSMSVKLCHNSSPVEKIGKTLDEGTSFDCVLKADTSLLKPTIILDSDVGAIKTYNYMYIDDFQRYYFIDDIVSKNNGIWEISGHVDVLETFKNGILSQQAVIRRQQGLYNLYLNDPDFMTYNYDMIQTKKFNVPAGGGFNKALNYVLVVNGS